MAGNERWYINQRHCHHLMLPKPALELPQSLRAAITAICIGRWDFNSFPGSKREVMNLTVQQRSWQGIPEPGVFMELSFRAKQGVTNLLKTSSNPTISSPNFHTKNQLSKFQSTVEERFSPVHTIFFGNTAHLLSTLSATEATERKITQCWSVLGVLSVIQWHRGLQASSTPQSAFKQALCLWYFWI